MNKVLLTSLLTLAAHQAVANEQPAEVTPKSSPVPAGLYVGAGLSYNDLDFGHRTHCR